MFVGFPAKWHSLTCGDKIWLALILGPTSHDACADPVQDIEPAIFISQSQPEANHGRKNDESLLSGTNWVDPIIYIYISIVYPSYTHYIYIYTLISHLYIPGPGSQVDSPTSLVSTHALRKTLWGSVENCTCRVTRRRRWGDLEETWRR